MIRPAGFIDTDIDPGSHSFQLTSIRQHKRLAGTAEPFRIARPEAVGLAIDKSDSICPRFDPLPRKQRRVIITV
jgi:hypothetical protein